jgi:choline dehydrogenase-like flavoprotein
VTDSGPTLLNAPRPLPASVRPGGDGVVTADIAIIGAGMGGATLAYGLRGSGADVLVIDRGDFLPREWENWSPEAVFEQGRYKNAEAWHAADGSPFSPGNYYYIGGNTKLYGAMLPRFREQDFGAIEHHDGLSAAWPVGYAEMEPFYAQAERLYLVHGEADTDPTDPWRSAPYPYPALPHEPTIAALADSFRQQGLHPFSMPAAVDRRPGGTCVRCRTCDGYPCMVDAKADADVCAIRPLATAGDIRLLTNTVISSLATTTDGKAVAEAVGRRHGQPVTVRADKFVVSAGAVNSAALLLRSGTTQHPDGLGNSSGLLGRNYMVHNSTFFVAADPRRRNRTRFQKTLALNDWYLPSAGRPYPLGNVQMLGKLLAPMVSAGRPNVPAGVLRTVTDHSVDLYLTTEDLPERGNRIDVNRQGQIVVHWTPNNTAPHEELVRLTTKAVRRAGYPLILTERMGIATNSHQCGTALMGEDPAQSVLDVTCRSHDVGNLWVVDSACFPSSAAVNPALTIAANALRVAAHGTITQ